MQRFDTIYNIDQRSKKWRRKARRYIWATRSMAEERKKAKEIVESLKNLGYHAHMAKTIIENDSSIFGNEREEIAKMVKDLMS